MHIPHVASVNKFLKEMLFTFLRAALELKLEKKKADCVRSAKASEKHLEKYFTWNWRKP